MRRRVSWILILQVAGITFVLLLVVGFIQDPFGWRKAKVERLEGEVATAANDAAARSLEAVGERETTRRVEVVVRQVREAETVTTELAIAANEAEDADTLLPPDRARRLGAHDDLLCRLSPGLCPPTPAANPAPGG